MRRVLIIISLSLVVYFLAAERMVVSIPNPSPATFQQFQNSGADIALYQPGVVLDVVIADPELAELIRQYPQLRITQTEAQLKRNLSEKSRDIPGYRSYDDLIYELDTLELYYPHLVEIYPIGYGWGHSYAELGLSEYLLYDHEISAIKLSDNVSQTEDEAQFYFLGTHHAREPISLEVTLEILYHMLDNYGTDPEITAIVNSSEIWFIPLMNPDGHKIVIDQTDVWWRKNIRDNNNNQQLDTAYYGNGGDGVDINRNYSYMWGNNSASDNPFDVTYHGPAPFSEPETQALRDFLEARHFLAGISYHSYGEHVLYPYGFAQNLSGPDHQEQALLAEEMAATIPKLGYGTYNHMPSYALYPLSGSSEDWIYGTLSAFAFTIEMATEFIPPASVVPQILQDQLQAARILLTRKDYKTLTGHIIDAVSNTPLRAKVRVDGIDEHIPSRADTWSRADFGSYYRFLPEGTFTVHYSCPGYLSQTHSVEISATEQTVLDIALQPAELINQTVWITDLDDNPIAGACLELQEQAAYYSNAMGMIDIPNIYSGEYHLSLSHPDFATMQFYADFSGNLRHYRLCSEAVFYEDFELTLEDWDTTGTWGIVPHQAPAGSAVLTDSPQGNYDSNITSFCQTATAIDLSNAEMVNLSFLTRYEFDLSADYVALMYRRSSESEVHTLDIYSGSQDWSTKSYSLDFLAGESIYLAFVIYSDGSNTADGIYIDDIKVFTSNAAVTNHDLVSPVTQLICYPNPFQEEVQIKLMDPPQSQDELGIYNLKGQKIRTLDTSGLTSDGYALIWDGKDENSRQVASGIYFLRLQSRSRTLATKKILKLN